MIDCDPNRVQICGAEVALVTVTLAKQHGESMGVTTRRVEANPRRVRLRASHRELVGDSLEHTSQRCSLALHLPYVRKESVDAQAVKLYPRLDGAIAVVMRFFVVELVLDDLVGEGDARRGDLLRGGLVLDLAEFLVAGHPVKGISRIFGEKTVAGTRPRHRTGDAATDRGDATQRSFVARQLRREPLGLHTVDFLGELGELLGTPLVELRECDVAKD